MRQHILCLKSVLLLGVALSGCAGLPSLDADAPAQQESQAAAPGAAMPLASIDDLDAALRTAQMQRLNGDLKGAVHTLGQLLLAAPDDPRVLGEYGKTLVAKGASQDALAFLNRAIELQPNDWMLYSAQGVAFDQLGKYKEAQLAFDRALALKPGEPSVLNNSALSHLEAGDLDGAERLLQAAVKNGASDPKVASNLDLVKHLRAERGDRPAMARSAPTTAAVSALAVAPVPASVAVAPAASTPAAAEPPPAHTSLLAHAVATTPLAALPPAVKREPASDASAGPRVLASLDGPVASAPAARHSQPAPAPSAPVVHAETRVAPVVPSEPGAIFLQAGAFRSAASAGKVASSLSELGARLSPTLLDGRPMFRVRIGPFRDATEAEAALEQVHSSGYADARIVKE